MLDVYQAIYIERFILRRRSAGNGSEKQVYERRNDGGGTAGRTAKGIAGLSAKTMADELGTSTQPIFTGFGSMDSVRQEVYVAAMRVYDRYTDAGLKEKIPFLGVGMQYIRFAREEPELYRFLFLTPAQGQESGTMRSMRHLQTLVRPTLMHIYRMTEEEADLYFRNLWFVVHSLSTLIVTGDCPYSDGRSGRF